MPKKLRILFLLPMVFQGCYRSDHGIPIMGLNGKGKLEKFMVSENRFFRTAGSMIGKIKDQTLSQLDNKVEFTKANANANTSEENMPWRIRRVMVGIGMEATMGFEVATLQLEAFVELRISPKGSRDGGM